MNYTREWRFNNLPIRSDYYVLQPDGSLMVNYVQNPRDTDIDFSCHIFADDGNFSYSTTLVLKSKSFFDLTKLETGQSRYIMVKQV